MTKQQLFKQEYAKQLLRIADGDLLSAKVLTSAASGRPENICFMAQQIIEKAIKAVLCALKQPLPFTHPIEVLLDRLPAGILPPLGEDLIALTDYATIRLYQEGSEILTPEDLKASIDAAESTLRWAEQQAATALNP